MEAQARNERLVDRSLSSLSLLLLGLMLWFGITHEITRGEYNIIFLGIAMTISALTLLKEGRFLILRGKWLAMLVGALILFAVVPTIYLYAEHFPLLKIRAGDYLTIDYVLGGLILIPLMVLVWKETGLTMFVLLLGFLFYSFFGFLFPGLLFHRGMDIQRLIQVDVLEFEGIYGLLLGTMTTWVAIFLLYAALMRAFGSLDVIVKISYRLFEGRPNMLPQVPVVSSMIFGCFSGSGGANVAGTGSFTIPLMKRFGIPPKLAGAIEAAASSGGTVMPPIMGAIAFLIAEFLGVSYLHIVVVGFVPAVIFYVSVAASTYWSTKPYLTTAPEVAQKEERLPVTRYEVGKLVPLLVSITILFTFLALLWPIMRSVMYASAALVALQVAYELLFRGERSVRGVLRELIEQLYTSAQFFAIPAAMVAVMGSAIAIAVKALTYTTLGAKLSFQLVDLSQGNLLLMLFFTLLLCTFFGMTAGSIATYIIVVSVAVTPFVKLGVDPLVTHFIIFYLATAALITPPVAGSVIVAASLAGSSYMTTAWQAMKLGAPLLIMPLAFAIYPELLLFSAQTPLAMVVVFIGVIGLAYGLNKTERDQKSIILRTICLLASGLALFQQNPYLQLSGTVVALAILSFSGMPAVRLFFSQRKAAAPALEQK